MTFLKFFAPQLALAAVIGLGVGYLITATLGGHQMARRYLRRGILLAILIVLIALVAVAAPFPSSAQYDWSSYLLIIFTGGLIAWILSWPLRKQKAGPLLLEVGTTAQNKLNLGGSAFYLGLAIFMTLTFLKAHAQEQSEHGGYSPDSIYVATLLPVWGAFLVFLAIGLSKLELREGGICHMLSLIQWQRVDFYSWGKERSNLLMLQLLPLYGVFPRRVAISIPERHREAVNAILDEKLPRKYQPEMRE